MYPSPNDDHILGWRIDLRFDPDGLLYVGTVRELPELVVFSATRCEAAAVLREELELRMLRLPCQGRKAGNPGASD